MSISTIPDPSRIALFLDFDGTLVEIAPTPDAVAVPPTLPGVLTRLHRRLNGALAIVTGRPVATIDEFLPGIGLDACGLHGLERRIEGRVLGMPQMADLSAEASALRTRFAGHPGIVVENKHVSLAMHWRLAPEVESEARTAIDEIARRLGAGYRVQDGKAVCEIMPVSAGKGDGIRALMNTKPYAGRHPVFAGDDVTDEDGFRVVETLGGTTIKIGPGPTVARARLDTPADLLAIMSGWADGAEWKPSTLS